MIFNDIDLRFLQDNEKVDSVSQAFGLTTNELQNIFDKTEEYRNIVNYSDGKAEDSEQIGETEIFNRCLADLQYQLEYLCYEPSQAYACIAAFGMHLQAIIFNSGLVKLEYALRQKEELLNSLLNTLKMEKKAIENGKLTVKSDQN